MNSNQIREKYPQLEQLFSAQFYSGWTEDYESEEVVIVNFANHIKIDELLDVLLEIDEIKKEFPEDKRLKDVIEEVLGLGNGLGIYLIGMTAVEWLDFVESIIKRELNNRKNKT